MGYYQVLWTPDDAPMYLRNTFQIMMDNARVEGTSFGPLSFLPVVLPPLVAHDAAYLIAPLLVMLAGAWWFTARGADRLPALIAGGALGFAGYSFTLVSAGHRGFFDMTVYLMVVMGAMPRALSQQKLFYFALAGAAAGWTLMSSPDFGPVGLAAAALYAVWILATEAWRNAKVWKLAGGVAMALVFFALTSAGTLHNVFTTLLPGRQAVIAQTKANPAVQESAQEKWIFATNWSLPPEESVELIAPMYKGVDSTTRERPYWGRLGRAWEWEETKQGFPNFRQHTVYIGLAPLLIGLLAVVMYVMRRKTEKALRDVPFWTVVGVVALLLAFGRYTPFYKLFYAIPYMSFLRAPVKFIRVVEWAAAFGFAMGLTTLLRQPLSQTTTRNILIVLSVCAATCFVASMITLPQWAPQLTTTLGKIPEPTKAAFLRNAAHAFRHPMWAALILAGCVWLLNQRQTTYALLLLSAFLAIDTYTVAKPFVRAQDVRMNYTPSPAQAIFENETNQLVSNCDFIFALRGDTRLTWPLRRQGVSGTGLSPQSDPDSPVVRLYQSVFSTSKNPYVRYAQLAGARFIWLDKPRAEQTVRANPTAVSNAWYYDIINGIPRSTDKPSEKSIVLLRMANALPDAWFATQWISAATREAQYAAVFAPGYNPLSAPVTDAPSATNALQAAELLASDFTLDPARGSVRYRATTPAFLTVRLPYSAKLTAKLEDGTRLPVYVSSLFWAGVEIPAGEHTVTFRRDYRNARYFYLSLASMLLLLIGYAAKKWMDHRAFSSASR